MGTNQKHTPGPWERWGRAVYTTAKVPHWITGRDARCRLVAMPFTNASDASHEVDMVEDNPASEAEADANAALISAAPDLLEALEAMLKDYVSLAESGDAGFWDPEVQAEVIKARAAIAKARGGA